MHYVSYGAMAALSNGLGGCVGFCFALQARIYAALLGRLAALLVGLGLGGSLLHPMRAWTSAHTSRTLGSLILRIMSMQANISSILFISLPTWFGYIVR